MDRPNHASNLCSICLDMSAANGRTHLRSPGQPLAHPRPPPARPRPSLPPFQSPPSAPVPIPATMASRPVLGSTSPCRAAFIVAPPSLIRSVAAKPLELPPGYLVTCRVPCGQKAKSPRKMKAVSVYTVGLSTYSSSCSFLTHRFETYHNYELETQILIFSAFFMSPNQSDWLLK
jgi:hypothetical protein